MFPLTIASVDTVLFQGDVLSVNCPGKDGEVTILRNHVPFVTPLKPGEIRIKTTDEEKKISVEKGLLEVHKEGVTILL